MKCEIDLEELEKLGLTPDMYVFLYCLYKEYDMKIIFLFLIKT